jgi:hypothetical protein
MLKTECSVSIIGHVVFAENVSGVLFLMFGFGNLVQYENIVWTSFSHSYLLACLHICLVLGLTMGGD